MKSCNQKLFFTFLFFKKITTLSFHKQNRKKIKSIFFLVCVPEKKLFKNGKAAGEERVTITCEEKNIKKKKKKLQQFTHPKLHICKTPPTYTRCYI